MLAPWKKSYDKLSTLKSRDITLLTKVHLVKAMIFPVAVYGCETWAIKKAECQRIDAFQLWCWKKLLRVSWTAKRSNPGLLHCRKICVSNPHLNYQRLKHLPARRETRVQSLGREDPLEKEMATHSSTLAWKFSWIEKPCRLQSMGL